MSRIANRAAKWTLTTIAAVVAVYFFGYEWETQWNIESGRERRLQKLFGIPIYTSQPEDTILSKWIGMEGDGDDWCEVSSGPAHFLMVSWSDFAVLRDISAMNERIDSEAGRRALARLILDEVMTSGIGSVRSHCYNFLENALYSDVWIDSFSKAQIEEFWEKTTLPNKTQ